jgi:hypothetical protein
MATLKTVGKLLKVAAKRNFESRNIFFTLFRIFLISINDISHSAKHICHSVKKFSDQKYENLKLHFEFSVKLFYARKQLSFTICVEL